MLHDYCTSSPEELVKDIHPKTNLRENVEKGGGKNQLNI
jgi:hypothetical protein